MNDIKEKLIIAIIVLTIILSFTLALTFFFIFLDAFYQWFSVDFERFMYRSAFIQAIIILVTFLFSGVWGIVEYFKL